MTDPRNMPIRFVVRLDNESRCALASVLDTIQAPHRRAPSVSEAVRAALVVAAASMADAAYGAELDRLNDDLQEALLRKVELLEERLAAAGLRVNVLEAQNATLVDQVERMTLADDMVDSEFSSATVH